MKGLDSVFCLFLCYPSLLLPFLLSHLGFFSGDFKGIRIEDQNEVLWGFRKAPVSGVRGFEQDLGTVLQQGGWIRKTF